MIAVVGPEIRLTDRSGKPSIAELSPIIYGRRAIIFDCDDTLLVTAQSRWPVLISTALCFGYQISDEDIRRVWGEPYRQMIEKMLPGINVDDFTAIYKQASLKSLPQVASGATGLLSILAAKGTIVQVLTANHATLVEQDFNALGIRNFFSYIYGCDETDFHKPDGRALLKPLSVLTSLGLQKADVLYIGDGWRDLHTARNAGIDFAAVCTGLDRQEVFETEGLPEDHILLSLDELMINNVASG